MAKNNTLEDDLDLIRTDLVKEFGNDVIGEHDSALSKVNTWVDTGSFVYDKVIAGGRQYPCSTVPYGRQTELAGLNGSGKTTLVGQLIGQAQKQNAVVCYIDVEEAFDKVYMTKLGANLSKVLPIRADTIEDVIRKQKATIELISKKAPDRPLVMIWDSLGSTTTEALMEEEDPFATQAMNKKQRILSQGMEIINPLVAKSKTAYIYTNHVYANTSGYGEAWIAPGGNKVKFFASLRLMLTSKGKIKEKDIFGVDQDIGQNVEVKCMKNRFAAKKLTYIAHIYQDEGYCNDYSYFEYAKQLKIVQTGTWSIAKLGEEEVKFQGFSGFRDKVVKHPKYNLLIEQVLAAM